MKIFNKRETIVLVIILSIIGLISFQNYKISLRRGRDNERENDLGDIAKILDTYHEKNSTYPPSLYDSGLGSVPRDPFTVNGYSYLYLTDGKYFQLYASLEGKTDESVYNPKIEKLGLKCGNYVCNYGKTSGKTPLDKSIEEYENELRNVKK